MSSYVGPACLLTATFAAAKTSLTFRIARRRHVRQGYWSSWVEGSVTLWANFTDQIWSTQMPELTKTRASLRMQMQAYVVDSDRKIGAGYRIRTDDLPLTRRVLYQLS